MMREVGGRHLTADRGCMGVKVLDLSFLILLILSYCFPCPFYFDDFFQSSAEGQATGSSRTAILRISYGGPVLMSPSG